MFIHIFDKTICYTIFVQDNTVVGEQPYKTRDMAGSDSGLGHLVINTCNLVYLIGLISTNQELIDVRLIKFSTNQLGNTDHPSPLIPVQNVYKQTKNNFLSKKINSI